jgi:RND family efflux transporter MFP subunit
MLSISVVYATDTVVVAQPDVEQVVLTAFTRPQRILPVTAQVSGVIETVSYDVGDHIASNDVFAVVETVFQQLDLQQNAIEQQRAQANIAFYQREVDRYRKLAKNNNAAAAQYDQTVLTLSDHSHTLQSLVVQAQRLTETIRRAQIKVPHSWLVTARHIEPGQWVREGEQVGEVADFSQLRLPFAVTYAQLQAIFNQQSSLTVNLPELQRSVSAVTDRINPHFDSQTRKIALDLVIAVPSAQSRGGLRGLLTLQIPSTSGAVTLPAATVQRRQEEYWLQPATGEAFRVLLLGYTTIDGLQQVRVTAPQLQAGDRILMPSTP